jgi:hypothetical protein
MYMKATSGIGIMLSTGAVATAAAVLLAPIAAFAGPVAQSLDVDNKAKISAKGAAIRIPYSYLCQDGWEGNLSVQVVEALGNELASGYGNKTLKCTGAKKTATLYLQVGAYQGARPFKAGPASIVATLDSYDPKADPCANGGPCPAAPVAGGMPPGERLFSAASVPAGHMPADMPRFDTSAHSEFQGTIQLVD